MSPNPTEKLALFIDGANLYATAKSRKGSERANVVDDPPNEIEIA
jgi:uncharacterized LabA/DUF88 family protein